MENYNFERRFNLSELFYKESTEIIATIIFYISLLNFVLGCITLIVIATQTPATMASFQKLAFSLVLISTIYEIINTFYKPTVLLPLPIIIPVNPIPGITNALNFIGPYIGLLVYMIISTDLLLTMVIQRYFTMSKQAISHPRYLEKTVYGFIILTNFILVFTSILGNFGEDRLNEQKTKEFVQKNIIDSEKLFALEKYPTVLTVFQRPGFFASFERICLMGFGISRILAFIFFTHKNMKIVIGTNETPQNRSQHQMIIRLLKFEFLAALCFIIIPSNLLIFSIGMQIPQPLLPMYCNLAIKCYPSIDMLLTSILIKPYRNFVKKVFYKIFRINGGGTVVDRYSTPHN